MNNNYWTKQAINARLFKLNENPLIGELISIDEGWKHSVQATLDSYLGSDELIDDCIKQAKDNLAKMKLLTDKMKSLDKKDSDKWKQHLQSISTPGFPDF